MSGAVQTISDMFVERVSELFHGMPEGEPTWVTTGGREGALLAAVAALSADQASRTLGKTTVAAHVNHLVFSIGMVNRWAQGVEPEGDWSSSWSVQQVTAEEWGALVAELRSEAEALLAGPARGLDWSSGEQANYGFSTLAHTAYHLGAVKHMITQL